MNAITRTFKSGSSVAVRLARSPRTVRISRSARAAGLILLDTCVVIAIRDGDAKVSDRAAALRNTFAISIITRNELEAGLVRQPDLRPARELRLQAVLAEVRMFPVSRLEPDAYCTILAAVAFPAASSWTG